MWLDDRAVRRERSHRELWLLTVNDRLAQCEAELNGEISKTTQRVLSLRHLKNTSTSVLTLTT